MIGGNDFNFESVELLQYSLHKIKLKRGGSYMDPLEWIRNKLATINPKNYDDNNFFQYAITVALNHQNIENHPERISWHFLALKSVRTTNGYNRPVMSLSRLFCGITSNQMGDFYSLGCFHSFCTDNSLKKHKRLSSKHDYCHVDMPEEDKNILKYNHRNKSLKAPFTIYADFECLLKKEPSCQNNSEKSCIYRKAKHEPSGYSLSLVCSFDATKNRGYFCRGKDFCKTLKEIGTEIINYEEKQMIPLTGKENKPYER